jgi:hypothetical protein
VSIYKHTSISSKVVAVVGVGVVGEERRVVVEVGVVGEERKVVVEVGVVEEERRLVVEVIGEERRVAEVGEEALQSSCCLSKGAYINTIGIYNHNEHESIRSVQKVKQKLTGHLQNL